MFSKSGIWVLFAIAQAFADGAIDAIDRTIPDGVKSTGVQYKLIYGGEDLRIINEVVNEVDKSNFVKKEKELYDSLDPLPPMDVKCLMSADKYCSMDMKIMKGVLIQALKEDCKRCSQKEKERAGQIIAAMLIHDPMAWKVFLTRYDGLDKVQRIFG